MQVIFLKVKHFPNQFHFFNMMIVTEIPVTTFVIDFQKLIKNTLNLPVHFASNIIISYRTVYFTKLLLKCS